MAQKYGGAHSPGSGADTVPKAGRRATPASRAPARVDRAGARANLLFLPGIILLFTTLTDGPVTLVFGLVGGAVLTLAAWLLRGGLRAQSAYDARPVARRPALPRKLLASVLTGVGVGLAALTGDTLLGGAVLYGLAATALHVAAFGTDPLRDKRMAGVDTFQADRVARVVDEAEAHLDAMGAAIATLDDRSLDLHVTDFQATARQMIRVVEEDPRDLTEARRYLGVYLMGARDASVKYAELTRRHPDPAARKDYEALLTDLQQNFADRTEKLLVDDRADMDIEIKVLRDRLQRDGIGPGT